MEITKVEEIEDGFHRVSVNHNGMSAYYILEFSLTQDFAEELDKFKKFFFSNDVVEWSEFINTEQEIVDYFLDCRYLKNKRVDEILAKREEDYNKKCEVECYENENGFNEDSFSTDGDEQ
jgi:hypothetical protein